MARPDGDLGGLGGDDEEGEHLAGVALPSAATCAMRAVEGDEREVDRVEHHLDAHQRDEHVAPDEEADAADRRRAAR